jgi:hypothetical protein
VAPVPEARAETTFSWWKGASEDWISAVPTYHRLSYLGLWPGIDLSFSGGEGAVKYRFSVAPGTDPSLISLRYQGATSLRVSPEAELVVSTSLRDLTDPAPVAWSVFPDGSRLPVEAAWAVQGDTASFRLGSHDRSLPLVIDPVMLACATDSLAADSSTQLDHGEILVSSGPWR